MLLIILCMQKKTIVIVINDLGKGGAEVLLVGILPELNKRYNVVLVTLADTCDFPEDKIICSHRYILGLTNKFSVISGVIKMRRIIRRHNAALVSALAAMSRLRSIDIERHEPFPMSMLSSSQLESFRLHGYPNAPCGLSRDLFGRCAHSLTTLELADVDDGS